MCNVVDGNVSVVDDNIGVVDSDINVVDCDICEFTVVNLDEGLVVIAECLVLVDVWKQKGFILP